jgi:hypothetical protein
MNYIVDASKTASPMKDQAGADYINEVGIPITNGKKSQRGRAPPAMRQWQGYDQTSTAVAPTRECIYSQAAGRITTF